MRLIDADELKEQFLAKCVEECAICKYNNRLNAKKTEYTCGLIDNAPTVDTYTKDDMTREYLKGYNDSKDMNGRPQGEWIVSGYIDTCRGYVAKCSCCKEDTVGGGNFCPNCGEDMRGEKHDE